MGRHLHRAPVEQQASRLSQVSWHDSQRVLELRQVVVALMRLGQRYAALERAQGVLAAQPIYRAAAAWVCRHATEMAQVMA